VHLADWPDVSELPSDPGLVAGMDRAREVCSAAASLRKANGLRVRLPLPELTVVSPDAAALAEFTGQIADEVNVRRVTLLDPADAQGRQIGVAQRLTVNARAAGPRLGKGVQDVIRASKAGEWSVDQAGTLTCGGVVLLPEEYTLQTVIAEGQGATAMLPSGGFLLLDSSVTPELAAEGLARDVVRAVQQARRAAGLTVSDRIRLSIAASPQAQQAIGAHTDLITGETLATELELLGPAALATDPLAAEPVEVGDGESIQVRVST
jgi:isoleucyl-tRNA synthetase